MARSIDFKLVREICSLRVFLHWQGWVPTHIDGEQLRGPCLFHASSNPKSRSMAVKGTGWYCHKCKMGGDVIDLACKMRLVNPYEAALALCAEFKTSVPWIRDSGTGRGTA